MKKYSRKREAILEKVRSTDTHPTAEWVYTELKSEIPDISLATVYRNLSEFVEEGKVQSLGVVDGHERFDGCITSHPHFVCDKCGRVIDLTQEVDPYLDEAVGKMLNVKITHHDLKFHGVCSECSK